MGRGFSTLEEILAIAAIMGCFVYPMSLAARAAGREIARRMDRAERTVLTQQP